MKKPEKHELEGCDQVYYYDASEIDSYVAELEQAVRLSDRDLNVILDALSLVKQKFPNDCEESSNLFNEIWHYLANKMKYGQREQGGSK